jgi:hypothetical protein
MALGLVFGCAKPPAQAPEQAVEPASATADERGFDPLELPRDREIVPSKAVRAGSITGQQALIDADRVEPDDSTDAKVAVPDPEIDRNNGQAFRVQLYTGRVYGEARAAARVAEEIFDQPVYVDYEVPNYKVRVGSFADRDRAIDYQQKARTAGYTSAWVVMVKAVVKEAAPLYDNLGLPLMLPVEPAADSVAVSEGEAPNGDPEN